MEQEKITKKTVKTWLVQAIIVSLIFGFLGGGVSGYILSEYDVQSLWSDSTAENVLIEDSVQTSVLQIKEESATVDVVNLASPAVVSIVVTKDFGTYYQESSTPLFDFFGFKDSQPSGIQQVGAGTGFIIESDGLILTNRHVVNEQDVEYTVVLNDQETYDAKLVGVDTAFDVALLKVEATNLPILELGDSDAMVQGQTVIAIGNVLGEYQNSVTRGIISGKDRDVYVSGDVLENVIQTDAAINSGNSGGPLLNLAGQVIGINTAVDRQGESIAFAIPISFAKTAVAIYKEKGEIVRPVLGVRYIALNKEIADLNGIEYTYGALITRGEEVGEVAIIPGSPADKAGLVENDIILEVDGVKIDEENSLGHLVQVNQVGDTITLKIAHDGEEKEVKAILEEKQ